ncbi:Scr1 family TA system antitoxin-like transcriptional regulator [Micromonospora sp. WMMA1998]|uniref:Scr1 family TA system antitoxin-like transcriptional regulator n=1 Tax=Micromonospora sp. WMMA1998 TaxID=3015167 RepID=UPI00248BE5EC|nr:Scr1 family TA system antitoxin-like transcriptional regulator [Micromonospora sp. WMMA1998]WBC16172.1 Scr1 family TA system antitoxin-like transcriptional regulator [Micromonospora sp. WMMA1998]
MNRAVAAAMAEAGHTAESLAERVGVDPKTAARWASQGRIPQTRHRAQVAELLGRDAAELWPDALKRKEPAWFRPWADIEREAMSLRSFQLAWIPGLLQTEAYARATLAGEALSEAEIAGLTAARIARHAILRRDRPPLLIAVIDESVLRRTAGDDRAMMAEQLAHLAECATPPAVQVYVVPLSAGMYPGLGGPFTLAELPDGGRVAHVDSQAQAHIIDKAEDVATLERRWERLRGEALSRAHSLDVIREAARSWT